MEKTKRRKGYWGCGIVLLVLLLLVGWVAAIHWGVLEKLGLRQPISEQVFAPPPDRETSTALMGALQQAGMNTRGVEVYVLPMAGQEGSVAILTLDTSQGFDPERLFSDGGNWDALEHIIEQGGLQDLNVTRLAFDYVDQNGKSIATLTVSAEAVRQFSQEEIDEKEFIGQVMGRIDIPGLIREVTP